MSDALFDYSMLNAQAMALLDGEPNFLANCANVSALLFMELENVNWAGVYLMTEGELVVGPFQGKPACTRIALGKGVCGTAAQTRETQIIDNVHEFDGHIACDGASNSEIVLPIMRNGELLGVLDIDSPEFGRFSKYDAEGLQILVDNLVAASDA
ncbi:MAG: GAF domain-containing protein [Gammaproteobacteria bacterium]